VGPGPLEYSPSLDSPSIAWPRSVNLRRKMKSRASPCGRGSYLQVLALLSCSLLICELYYINVRILTSFPPLAELDITEEVAKRRDTLGRLFFVLFS
jgi:hypothetical protein